MHNQSQFAFGKLKRRRPLWVDMMIFVGIVFMVWGATHIFMNRSAFSQIAEFKYETLKASLFTEEAAAIEAVQPKLEKLQPVKRNRVSLTTKNLKPKNQAKEVFSRMAIYPSDNRLYIPRIKKNVPLISVPGHQNWNQLEQFIQAGLQDGVVVHPVSHAPGNYGNFFLTGHSSYYDWDPGRFKDVFALLHEVEVGDTVEVYWEGKKYEYLIRLSEIVPPTAVEVLNQPKDRSIMTLMTCTPVGTNKNRLILTAELQN